MHTKEFTKWLKAEFPQDDKHHKQAREALGITLNGMNKAIGGDVVSVRMKKKMILYKAKIERPTDDRKTKFDKFLNALATDEAFCIDEAANWILDYFDLISL